MAERDDCLPPLQHEEGRSDSRASEDAAASEARAAAVVAPTDAGNAVGRGARELGVLPSGRPSPATCVRLGPVAGRGPQLGRAHESLFSVARKSSVNLPVNRGGVRVLLALPKDNPEFALAVLNAGITQLEADVREIRNIIKAGYVQKLEFEPVKYVVFGLIGVTLMVVVGTLVALVVAV